MKELLQTFFKTTEERLKNPFIGTFITSWLLFNWKAIVFFVLSSKDVEERITYIECNFSDIWFVLIFPLSSCVFYVLILPYLNLAIDSLLRYSNNKRNLILIENQKVLIENKKLLSIEEIKLEEAKTEFRERKNHNKLVEDLQQKIIDVEKDLQTEKESNSRIVNELKTDKINLRKQLESEIVNSQTNYNKLVDRHERLMKDFNEIKERSDSHKIFFKDKEKEEGNVIYSNKEGLAIRKKIDGDRIYYIDQSGSVLDEKQVNDLKKRGYI